MAPLDTPVHQTEKPIPPPPPPPPPPAKHHSRAPALKLKTKTHDPFFRPSPQDSQTPAPTGSYFFYGSLLDPHMLVKILDLNHEPTLRPASLDGYECKSWGQYPALLKGEPGGEIEGAVYDVGSLEHAAKLAEYETSSYRPTGCAIRFLDGREPAHTAGYVFLFVGNPRDLGEGCFDLEKWLESVGSRGGGLHWMSYALGKLLRDEGDLGRII